MRSTRPMAARALLGSRPRQGSWRWRLRYLRARDRVRWSQPRRGPRPRPGLPHRQDPGRESSWSLRRSAAARTNLPQFRSRSPARMQAFPTAAEHRVGHDLRHPFGQFGAALPGRPLPRSETVRRPRDENDHRLLGEEPLELPGGDDIRLPRPAGCAARPPTAPAGAGATTTPTSAREDALETPGASLGMGLIYRNAS